MRKTLLALSAALVSITASPAAQQAPRATFRSDVELVVVDVVVRDRSGNAVRGLTAADFEVREDNRPQQIVSFDVEEVTTERAPDSPGPPVLAVGTQGVTTERAPAPEPEPVKREDLAGRRLIVLLFDLSSMQPEELTRAGKAAVEYLDTQMAEADLVAVATVDVALNVVADFTGDREQVKAAMARFSAVDGVAFETPA
ncbi:MAG TPA: VWA domain-containing protein, partial [Vicinamibacterales bacterium]|nr:VWA domain-containing protein [Vicinamibacterales bacterium]